MYEGSFAKEILEKWQAMTNLMVEVFAMPVGIIICQRAHGNEVIIVNDGGHQCYKAGTILTLTDSTNRFCKNVMRQCMPLAVYKTKQNNETVTSCQPTPDKKFNTFIGCPLSCPDGSIFGIICALDYQSHPAEDQHIALLSQFSSLTESDLRLLDRLRSATDLSLKDDLTGVYNRRGFNVLSQKQYFSGKRTHIKFAFMIADIDRLKRINDNFGHKTGDKAIVTLADALTSSLRECDLVARVGGDEFYIALNLNKDDEIATIISRTVSFLELHPIESGTVTFSWGVSIRHYSDTAVLSLEELIDEADKMLYENKNRKVNTVV